ncbi:MAG: hypothetical protein EFT35_01010 [Methanophagales archaeon ANME-1-THS]|nr:MAG: hypothetical protein EFT35_01010 [Methanophagales archaeon ANME-1-THS]
MRQKKRGKNAKAEEMDTVAAKVTNPEKEEFYRICYLASQESDVLVTPSKVLRSFVRAVINAGEVVPQILDDIERFSKEEGGTESVKK